MTKRRRIIAVLIAVIFVGVVVAAVWPWDREPEYQGKKLSQWLEARSNLGNREAYDAAGLAVGSIGTNALPWLLRWLQYEPSRNREIVISALTRLLPTRVTSSDAFRDFTRDKGPGRHSLAWVGFSVLKTQASPAAPKLVELLAEKKSPAVAARAVVALRYIGNERLPAVVAFVQDQNRPNRVLVIEYINQFSPGSGTRGAAVVPVLVNCMREKDAQVVAEAASALGKYHLEGEVVVPTLVTGLDHPDVKVRKASAKALGLLGKDAQSAVRALMSAGGDPLLGISEEVNVALHAIEVDRNRPTPLFEFSEDGIYYRADAPLNGEK